MNYLVLIIIIVLLVIFSAADGWYFFPLSDVDGWEKVSTKRKTVLFLLSGCNLFFAPIIVSVSPILGIGMILMWNYGVIKLGERWIKKSS